MSGLFGSSSVTFLNDDFAFDGLVDAIESHTGGIEGYNPSSEKDKGLLF